MRAVCYLAFACVLARAEDPREIVRRSVNSMNEHISSTRNYTFLERTELRDLDSNGRTKSRKVEQFDVTLLEGSPYRRLVGKDDHALTPGEQRKEEKKLQDSISQRQKESPEQRARRVADWQKKREREWEPVREIPDAFDFRVAGETQVDGRPIWIIAGTPHPGYIAHTAVGKFFPKFRGTLWIDKADYQWVKIEGEVTEDISWGLFVARLNKGAHLSLEMTRVNDEVWLPKRIEAGGSARIALLKKYNEDEVTTFSNYRKFQAESRIVSMAPAQ